MVILRKLKTQLLYLVIQRTLIAYGNSKYRSYCAR